MPTEEMVARIRRALSLDQSAFEEVRDDASFTPVALGGLAAAVFLAGLGAYLWGEVVLDFSTPGGWFVDSFVLGSIFTILLMLAGVVVVYLMLTQAYGESVAPEGLLRVMAVGHLPYAIGFFLFIPEINFAIGLLAIAGTVYYTLFGLRAAYPAVSHPRMMLAVALGFAVWAVILPIISDGSDGFVTGIFGYSLVE